MNPKNKTYYDNLMFETIKLCNVNEITNKRSKSLKLVELKREKKKTFKKLITSPYARRILFIYTVRVRKLVLFSYSSSHCRCHYPLHIYVSSLCIYLIRMYTHFVIILFSFYFLLHIEVKFIL